MNPIRFNFIKQNVSGDLSDKAVLEVGSRIVSGSIRGYFESLNPKEYVGVDIVAGEGVDQILNIHDLASHFGNNVFDIIICSDTLEHIEDYQSASLNMHAVLKIGGILIVSVPTMQSHYHGFPHDYWRYTLDDLRHIYKGMKVLAGDDTEGAIIILEKQSEDYYFEPDYPIYSILRGKPIIKHSLIDKKLLSLYRINILALRRFFVRYTPPAIKRMITNNFTIPPVN